MINSSRKFFLSEFIFYNNYYRSVAQSAGAVEYTDSTSVDG